MKHANLSFLAIAAALLLSGPTMAAPIPPELAKAVADYDAAQIKGDAAELRRLLADDYTLLNSSGKTETKAQLIADYTAPDFKLEPYVVREPIEKVWNNGAVMGGVVTLRGTDGGKPFESAIRFADIWARRHGVWQVIYTHVSKPK